MTFRDFLCNLGFEATTSIDPLIKAEIININGENFLYRDIPKTRYWPLMRQYHQIATKI